jgi:tyrosine-protein kinase Etk/Wzc
MAKKVDSSNLTSVDLKKYIFKILSHWYLFIFFIVVSYLIVFFRNKYVITSYSLNTTILIKEQNKRPESFLGGLPISPTSNNLQNEMGLLTSYYLAQVAVKELDFYVSYFESGSYTDKEIYKKCPFRVQLDSAVWQPNYQKLYVKIVSDDIVKLFTEDEKTINQTLRVGDQFKLNNFCFRIMPADTSISLKNYINNKYFFYFNDFNSLVLSFKNRLKVQTLAESSSILWLWMTGSVPEKDADYLNKIVEVYIKHGLEEKNQVAVSTIAFIDNQLKTIIDSLTTSQDNLQNFRLANKFVDANKEGGGLFQKLDETTGQTELLSLRRKYFEYLKKEINANENMKSIMAPSIMGIEDPLMVSLLEKLSELYEQKEITQYSIKTDIPNLEVLKYKIEKSKEALNYNLANNIKAIDDNLKALNCKLDTIRTEIDKLPATERIIQNYTRKFEMNNGSYNFLLNKRSEAAITKASNQSDVKVLDPARADNAQASTQGFTNPISAIIIGLLIPLLIIFVKEYFNTIITDRSEIEERTDISILGSIGHNEKAGVIAVYENPKSVLSESFRTLRTNLQYLLIDKPSHVVSVTSTTGGEGKTFCAINLASIIAMSNKKVLLIGLDLRKPKVGKNLGLSNSHGVSSFLIGSNTLEEIIQATQIENLSVITAGPIPPNPAELIETKKMAEMINELKKRYEYIIIDTPPVALVTDALLISKYTDANIFVIRQDYSNRHVLKLLNELTETGKISNVSILINDVKLSTNYGYKFGYKYGYKYGYGYGYSHDAAYFEDEKPQKKWYENLKFWDQKKA